MATAQSKIAMALVLKVSSLNNYPTGAFDSFLDGSQSNSKLIPEVSCMKGLLKRCKVHEDRPRSVKAIFETTNGRVREGVVTRVWTSEKA
jgi:hypothetical protein